MRQSYLVFDFFTWYYTRAFRDLLAVWVNIGWFIIHFFSIPLLLRTLFLPWKRVTARYTRTGFEDIAETFVMNVTSRLLGASMRLGIAGVGIVLLVVAVIGLFATLIVWLSMPIIFVVGLVYGLMIFML